MSERVASNSWYIYGGALVACLALFFLVTVYGDKPEQMVSVVREGDTKTYTDMRYGFRFTYPASFELTIPTSEMYVRKEYRDLSETAFESKLLESEEQDRRIFENLNRDVVQGAEESYKNISVGIFNPEYFPTEEDLLIECEESKRLNPNLSPEEACFPQPPSRELLTTERKMITQGTLGSVVPPLHVNLRGGVLVETNGIRGIRGLTIIPGLGEYSASFTTYTKDGNRVSVAIRLWMSDPGRTIFPNDPAWLQRAESDPRNKVMDDIISTFEFLE